MHTHVRGMAPGVRAWCVLSSSVACGGNTANGWRVECLRLWNQVDRERQTIPRAMEFDAEANIWLNKEADFWLSLFTSNSPGLPLLSLPLLLYSTSLINRLYVKSLAPLRKHLQILDNGTFFFLSFKNIKAL